MVVNIQEFLDNVSQKYPIIGFSVSAILMVLGVVFPDIQAEVNQHEIEVPKIIMQLIQLAFGAAGLWIAYSTYKRNKKK